MPDVLLRRAHPVPRRGVSVHVPVAHRPPRLPPPGRPGPRSHPVGAPASPGTSPVAGAPSGACAAPSSDGSGHHQPRSAGPGRTRAREPSPSPSAPAPPSAAAGRRASCHVRAGIRTWNRERHPHPPGTHDRATVMDGATTPPDLPQRTGPETAGVARPHPPPAPTGPRTTTAVARADGNRRPATCRQPVEPGIEASRRRRPRRGTGRLGEPARLTRRSPRAQGGFWFLQWLRRSVRLTMVKSTSSTTRVAV